MPARSIRDDMQQNLQPPAPRTYGTPIGATGGKPINTGRLRAGPAPEAQRRAAIQKAIGPSAASPAPARAAATQQPLQRPTIPNTPPQQGPSSNSPTTLVPGNPTADLSAQTAGNRIMERPGLINQAVDNIAR